jgi:hypothetical protein
MPRRVRISASAGVRFNDGDGTDEGRSGFAIVSIEPDAIAADELSEATLGSASQSGSASIFKSAKTAS